MANTTSKSSRDGRSVDTARAGQSMFTQSSDFVIQDGKFSAIGGSRYGRLNIVINQGRSRSYKSKHRPLSDLSEVSTDPSIASDHDSTPSSWTPRQIAPLRYQPRSPQGSSSPPEPTAPAMMMGEEPSQRRSTEQNPAPTALDMVDELRDQIAFWTAKTKGLELREEMIEKREHALDARERETEELRYQLDVRSDELDQAEERLSSLRIDLIARESLIKEAIQDLRRREVELKMKLSVPERVDSGTARASTTSAVSWRSSSSTVASAHPRNLTFPRSRPLPHPKNLSTVPESLPEDPVRETFAPRHYRALPTPKPSHSPSTSSRRPHLPPLPLTVDTSHTLQDIYSEDGERTVVEIANGLYPVQEDDEDDRAPPVYTKDPDSYCDGHNDSSRPSFLQRMAEQGSNVPTDTRFLDAIGAIAYAAACHDAPFDTFREMWGALSPTMPVQRSLPTVPGHGDATTESGGYPVGQAL